jgi:protein TonB
MSFVLVLSICFVFLEWKQETIYDFTIPEDPLSYIDEEYEYSPPEKIELIPYIETQPATSTVVIEGFRELEEPVAKLKKTEITPLNVEVIKPEDKLINLHDEPVLPPENEIFTSVDSMPEFPGGLAALIQYIYGSIRYPADARELRVQGRIIASFIINKDGTVSDIKIEKSIYHSLDEETLRVLYTLPPWKPGKRNNHPIKVKYIVPISYRL